MQKKNYIKPKIEEVDLTKPNMILCASNDDDEYEGGEFASILNINKQA